MFHVCFGVRDLEMMAREHHEYNFEVSVFGGQGL